MFRDMPRRNVTVKIRPTVDLRSPRDAHRYRRLRECTRHIGSLLAEPVKRLTHGR